MLKEAAGVGTETADWISDRKNRRIIPPRLERCGYEPVRNEAAEDGLWKIKGKRQAVYAHRSLSTRERLVAARKLTEVGRVSEVSDLSMQTFPECQAQNVKTVSMRKSLTSPTTLTAGDGSRESPPICAHCGAPATAEAPVQLCAVEGEKFLLHRHYQATWLAAESAPSYLRRTS
jgi:hypothetical protein